MKSAVLIRLKNLLGMVRTAEESRLSGAMAEIAACHSRAAQLRQEIGGPCRGVASRGDPLVAADMVAASHWMLRLAERADAEEARAVTLEAEAAVIRDCLARAFGRESAAAAMLEKARGEERRLTARRVEGAIITRRIDPGKKLDQ